MADRTGSPQGDRPVRRARPRVTETGPWERLDLRRHPVAVVVAMACLVAGFVAAMVGLGVAIEEGDRRVDIADVLVPDVAGLPEEEALREVDGLGLIMVVEEAPNELVEAGNVFDQEPIPGARVEVGSPVTVFVSTGPAGTIVPETSGQQRAEAETTLSRVGLTASVVSVNDEEVRPGEVIGSSPGAGRRAPPDGVVELRVSAGPAPRVVPEVGGRSGVEVLAELGRIDLVPGSVSFEVTGDAPDGAAISVDPPPGTEVPRYSEVDVVIAIPAEPGGMPSVTGLLESTARRALDESGVDATFRRVRLPAGDSRSGRVVRQGVPAGTAVPAGLEVEVLVGVAPPPPTTTTAPPPTTQAPPSGPP